MNFYILSEPIQAGKSTSLGGWYQKKKNETKGKMYGILSPDINGIRHFEAIEPGKEELKEVQVAEEQGKQLVENADPDIFIVGKKCFYFRHSSFNWAIDHLYKYLKECTANIQNKDETWLILDEVGPLEVKQGKGFDAFMLQAVQEYKQYLQNHHQILPHTTSLNYLIVVRDGLVDDFLQHYGLSSDQVSVIKSAHLQNL